LAEARNAVRRAGLAFGAQMTQGGSGELRVVAQSPPSDWPNRMLRGSLVYVDARFEIPPPPPGPDEGRVLDPILPVVTGIDSLRAEALLRGRGFWRTPGAA